MSSMDDKIIESMMMELEEEVANGTADPEDEALLYALEHIDD